MSLMLFFFLLQKWLGAAGPAGRAMGNKCCSRRHDPDRPLGELYHLEMFTSYSIYFDLQCINTYKHDIASG